MTASEERPGRIHQDTAREAGFGRLSFISVLAGTMCAYGAFAVIAAAVGAVLKEVDVDTDFESNNWTGSGAVASLASALVLLLAYLFGGYVAGRMARRAAILHGVAVFVLSLVLGAVIGAVAGLSEGDEITENLRSIGVPTTNDQISNVAIVGALVSLLAILVGAVLGALLGERWHTKLARRAADPSVGPAADARARVEKEDQLRDERIGHDEVVRRDLAPRTDLVDGPEGDVDRPAPVAPPTLPPTPAAATDATVARTPLAPDDLNPSDLGSPPLVPSSGDVVTSPPPDDEPGGSDAGRLPVEDPAGPDGPVPVDRPGPPRTP